MTIMRHGLKTAPASRDQTMLRRIPAAMAMHGQLKRSVNDMRGPRQAAAGTGRAFRYPRNHAAWHNAVLPPPDNHPASYLHGQT
jgi:hypothetical protein